MTVWLNVLLIFRIVQFWFIHELHYRLLEILGTRAFGL